jgi:hypothetical protein
MKPELMEALQMLKFMLRKKHLDFMEGWRDTEAALTKVEEDLLGLDNLLAATEGCYVKILNSLVQDENVDNDKNEADSKGGNQELGGARNIGTRLNRAIVMD